MEKIELKGVLSKHFASGTETRAYVFQYCLYVSGTMQNHAYFEIIFILID